MNKITANIVNSLLAGALVFLGSCSTGEIDQKSIIIAISASFIVAITQFKDYLIKSEQLDCPGQTKLFNFLNL